MTTREHTHLRRPPEKTAAMQAAWATFSLAAVIGIIAFNVLPYLAGVIIAAYLLAAICTSDTGPGWGTFAWAAVLDVLCVADRLIRGATDQAMPFVILGATCIALAASLRWRPNRG